MLNVWNEMKGNKRDRCKGWLETRIGSLKIMTTASKNVVYLRAFFYLLRKYKILFFLYHFGRITHCARMHLLFFLLCCCCCRSGYCSLNIEFNGQLNWHNVYNCRQDADAFSHRHTQNRSHLFWTMIIFFEYRIYLSSPW